MAKSFWDHWGKIDSAMSLGGWVVWALSLFGVTVGAAIIGLLAWLQGAPAWLISMIVFVASGTAIVLYLFISAGYIRWRQARAISKARAFPSRKWLPIANAPFELPQRAQYADRFGQRVFYDHMLADELDNGPRLLGMRYSPAVPAYRNSNGADLIVARVDWDKRAFQWWWGTTDTYTGFSIRPWEAETTDRWKWFIPESVWAHLKQKSLFLWQIMTIPLDEMIQDGSLRVWARLGAATAPFTLIAPDAWRHFQIVDWDLGSAASDCEKLYSIHVEPLA